jgi:FtsP/CotA-like multicopper oxidase with cupredoxin domain
MTFYGIFFFYIIFWTAVVSPTPILNRGYEPKTNIFDFTIEKVTLAPDGFTRQLSTVNGQYPGPTIEVNKGDRIVMKINNKLGEPTGNLQRIFFYVLCVVRVFKSILQNEILAIHAHGMLQRGTPWYVIFFLPKLIFTKTILISQSII